MPSISLTIAIASDLHCHSRHDFPEARRESHLIANDSRVPADRHPIQSLMDLIGREGLRSDALLCPGDLAHKASAEGLSQGCAHVRELGVALAAREVCFTLGNHDVASR